MTQKPCECLISHGPQFLSPPPTHKDSWASPSPQLAIYCSMIEKKKWCRDRKVRKREEEERLSVEPRTANVTSPQWMLAEKREQRVRTGWGSIVKDAIQGDK